MIDRFPEQTAPLSQFEEEVLLPAVTEILGTRFGRKNQISNAEIRRTLNEWHIASSGPRIRKVINHIRRNGIIKFLLAGRHGYYIAEDLVDIEDYICSLRHREEAIKEIRTSLETQAYVI